MASLQEYLFDACGHVKLENYLPSNEVMRLTEELEAHWGETRSAGFLRIRDLLKVSPRLVELANQLPRDLQLYRYLNQPYRLIESYGLKRSAESVQHLHNGFSQPQNMPWGSRSSRTMWRHHTYHDGKTYCMMVKVLVYLTDVRSLADGPFCWLEGSHKSNYALPLSDSEIRTAMTIHALPSMRTVDVRAGDIIILNEALMHGTIAKTSTMPRVVLAFSYAPRFVADYREVTVETNDVILEPGFYV